MFQFPGVLADDFPALSQPFFRLHAFGDVVEKDGDFPAFGRADAKGIDIKPTVQLFRFVHKPNRFARPRDFAVNFKPIFFKIRGEFADPFSQRVVHTGLLLERRINF